MGDGLRVVVFAGGEAPGRADLAGLGDADLTIAADSGFDHALEAGWACDLLVGDLDSVSSDGLAEARRRGVEIVAHPVDKDHTDLELALLEATERGASAIAVVGGYGGRLDHLLANVEVLTAAALEAVDVQAHMAGARLSVVRSSRRLSAPVGAFVSLLPKGGSAEGVTTTGLRWNLVDEPLQWGTARGVSNEVVTAPAEVSVRAGVLLVVEPGPPTA